MAKENYSKNVSVQNSKLTQDIRYPVLTLRHAGKLFGILKYSHGFIEPQAFTFIYVSS